MKTVLKYTAFAALGALLALAPINLGDLRTFEAAILAVLLAAIASVGGVFLHDFIINAKVEKAGGGGTTLPLLPHVIAGVVGALLSVVVSTL